MCALHVTSIALDELRRAEPDVPSRGEMLRRLIQWAAVAKAAKPRGKT